MTQFDVTGMESVTARVREIGSRSVRATVYSRPAPPAPFPEYEVHVSDYDHAYRIVGIDGFESAIRLANGAPDPNRANHGATARHCYTSTRDGRTWRHEDFLRTLEPGPYGPEAGRYYPLEKFGHGAPSPTSPDPELLAVTVDVTGRWGGGEVSALGRVRAVYAYVPVPEARPDGSPSAYLMRFVGNACERDEPAAYASAGYADRAAFQADCRGHAQAFASCDEVDGYEDRAAIELADVSVDAHALCVDPEERARILATAVEEALAAAAVRPVPFLLAPEPEPTLPAP